MRSLATIAFLLAAAAVSLGQATRHGAIGPTVAFVSDTKQTEIPFAIANNLIILKVSLNGSRPEWFIFDTGAESTVIDTEFAKQLSVKQSGTTVGTGSAGTATAGVIKGVTLQLGAVRAQDLTVYSLPLTSFTPTLGVRVSGIVGNDVIKHAVADIDYENCTLHLYAPEAFTPPSDAEMVPVIIEGNLPFIRTEIVPIKRAGVPAKLELDTGSTGIVLFNGPFVVKHRLVSSLARSMNAKTGGVGGTGQSTVGRIQSLRIAGWDVPAPIAVLYRGTRGDNASARYDGLLGGAIFRRFRFIIDMPGRRAYFKPNATLANAFDMDMSGLELVADGDDLKTILIDEVFADSAGAKAGIKGGEILETIDGRSAPEIGIQEVRRMLREDGKEYDLGLRRGKDLVHIKLRLTRVI